MSGDSFRLSRTHGHEIQVHVAGPPHAPAILLLHGGPGGGAALDQARHHDLSRWRVVQFDQRGTGSSGYLDPLAANTTADQLGDIEAVRAAVGASTWTVAGGSWGALLAVLYAQAHPQAVDRLVLRSIFLGRDSDRAWLLRDAGPAPHARRRVVDLLGDVEDPFVELDLLLAEPTGAAARHVAEAWVHLERVLSGLASDVAAPAALNARQRLDVRIEMHYLARRFFLPDDHAALRAGVLDGIDGVVLQGDHDDVIAPDAADHLVRGWTTGTVRRVRLGGHSLASPPMRDAWRSALREPSRAGAGGGR